MPGRICGRVTWKKIWRLLGAQNGGRLFCLAADAQQNSVNCQRDKGCLLPDVDGDDAPAIVRFQDLGKFRWIADQPDKGEYPRHHPAVAQHDDRQRDSDRVRDHQRQFIEVFIKRLAREQAHHCQRKHDPQNKCYAGRDNRIVERQPQ